MSITQAISYLISTVAITAIAGVAYLELSEPLRVQGGDIQGVTQQIPQNETATGKPAQLDLKKYSGEWSVYYKEVGQPPIIDISSDHIYHGASVTKVLTAIALLKKVDNHEISLTNKAGDTTLSSLLTAMVNRSDNDAWEYLNNLVGFPLLQKLTGDLGMKTTNLADNKTTTADMGLLLEKLIQGQLLSPDSTKLLLTLMTKTETENRITPAIPQGAEIFHKTGTFGQEAFHDAAIIKYNGKTFVLVIFGRKTNWEEGSKTIQQITKSVIS